MEDKGWFHRLVREYGGFIKYKQGVGYYFMPAFNLSKTRCREWSGVVLLLLLFQPYQITRSKIVSISAKWNENYVLYPIPSLPFTRICSPNIQQYSPSIWHQWEEWRYNLSTRFHEWKCANKTTCSNFPNKLYIILVSIFDSISNPPTTRL